MCRTRTSERTAQSGFTLAGLIVVMTIMMIFITATVPKQWSKVMQRERDYQTIFAMKQYARAIRNFQLKHGTPPVSLDQLKEAKSPRFMRGGGEMIDPLTGEVDWIVVPAAAVQGATVDPRTGQRVQPGQQPGQQPAGQPQPLQPNRPGQQQQGQIVGPIAGVRPNKTGQSFLTLNGAETYETWSYTVMDLENEINIRRQALLAK
ncbi:MAG TPA: type II secretion system protein [Thermoanaerobaculia bacterium]|nr:type II secretion system protein [Thermoanaerobaculia bacterium]